jgi:uncharacterized phage protein (TIGR01671 family)
MSENSRFKFRAWNASTKVMSEVFSIEDLAMFRHKGCDFNGSAFMQCTGLHDKNGKEIYDGDILKYEATPYDCGGITSIEWSAPNFISTDGKSLFPFGTKRAEKSISAAEIIGNIYQNPGLIG